MILQALYEYYRRRMADPDPARRLPGFGMEDKEIGFIVELTPAGRLASITDTHTRVGKKLIATSFLVPRGGKRTSGISSNLLWDTPEYALGLSTGNKSDRVAEKHVAFRARIEAMPREVRADAGVSAVRAFLDGSPRETIATDPLWEDVRTGKSAIAFRLAGDADLVCQRPAVIGFSLSRDRDDGDSPPVKLPCLVTGEVAAVERRHNSIKGVWDAQTSGANIVSFNLAAFNSFGKVQGTNAPVSEAAAFAYTTALNHLLGRNSRQRFQVGDASTVFWAQQPDDSDVEDAFAGIFGETVDPDGRTEQIRALFEAIRSGRFDGARGAHRFFVLGLAPNAARIAVRFWHAAPLRDIAERVRTWFDDLSIVRGPNDPEYPSLFRLLSSVATQGKADNIPPNLGGDVMRSALSGGAFPTSWLSAAVQRCRSEQHVSYFRAAAIKACLNRATRFEQATSSNTRPEITPMLDSSNPSVAYRLGRLFAVLEKVQEEANPGINATIRERYYGAASSAPVTVFTTLLRLKNHHLAKLENRGRAVNLEKLIGEIVDGVDAFPGHLALPEQGRFAIGYYHQRQAFFAKSADN